MSTTTRVEKLVPMIDMVYYHYRDMYFKSEEPNLLDPEVLAEYELRIREEQTKMWKHGFWKMTREESRNVNAGAAYQRLQAIEWYKQELFSKN